MAEAIYSESSRIPHIHVSWASIIKIIYEVKKCGDIRKNMMHKNICFLMIIFM